MPEREGTITVFAYGSNLCVSRIAARVDDVRTIATGTVCGYALRFNKKSRDGSGKANAHRTDHAADIVWGAVYALSETDKRTLDGFEGLGRDYFESEVEVETPDGSVVSAWMYWGNPERLDDGLAPYSWYHRFCLEGARQHDFPDSYVDAIARVTCIVDPDAARHEHETLILRPPST